MLDTTEEKLTRIQKSTRTTMPFFVPIHNFLRMKFKWYYNWHLWHNSSKAHFAVLIATVLGLCFGLFSLTGNVVHPPQTSAAVGDNWIVSGAGDGIYNQTFYYLGTHNGSDYFRAPLGINGRSFYLFKATNAAGTITWRLNDELQADLTPPATADYWTIGDTLPGGTWNFDPSKPEISPAPTSVVAGSTDGILAGTVYTNSGESIPIGAGKMIALSIDGGAKTTAETNSNGQFFFSEQTYGAGSVISIFVDEETEKASNIFTTSSAGGLTGLVLIQNNIKLGAQNSGTITNAILDTADNVSDPDLGVSVSGGNATFVDNQQLWVRYDKTYNPGGSVSCHDMRVNGTLTMGSNTLIISGSLTTAGTSVGQITTSSTVTFTSTISETINAGGSNLNTTVLNGVGGEWTLQSDFAAVSISIAAGTLNGSDDKITISGTGAPFVINGTFVASTGTVEYTGAGNTTIAVTTYYNLNTKPTGSSPTYTFDSGNINVNGNYVNGDGSNFVTVTARTNNPVLRFHGNFSNVSGAFYFSQSAETYVSGDFTNELASSVGTELSSIYFDGAASQTITANGTSSGRDYHRLYVTNTSTQGILFADSITMYSLTAATALSKISVQAGATVTISSDITINGQATGTRVVLRSSSDGSPWYLNSNDASPAISYADVKDSDASGGLQIDASDGTNYNSGGNTNWLFPTKTISGVVFSDNTKTGNIGSGKKIALSLNGGPITTVETGEGGAYSFSNVAIPENGVIALFISGETEKGSIIIHTGTVDTTYIDMEWYVGNVKPSFRAETDILEITNAELDVADNVADSDLGVSVSGGTATFADGRILYVWNNKTYRPGGAVVADNVEIDGVLNMESNALTVSGSFNNSNTFTSAGTVLFDATSSEKSITSNGSSLGAMTFNGIGGEWTLQDDLAAASLSITNGKLIDNGKTVTVNGNILISSQDNSLLSTGKWIMTASGSIHNSFTSEANWLSNRFHILEIGAGANVDRTDNTYADKLILNANSNFHGGYFHIPVPAAVDPISADPTAVFSGNLSIHQWSVSSIEQESINFPDANMSISYGSPGTLKLTGDLTVKSLSISGAYDSTSETKLQTLDTNGHNLSVNGDVSLGSGSGENLNGYFGKLILGSGTHTITGNVSVPQSAFGTQGFIDFGTANIYVGGNFDLSSTTVTPGTATIHMNATAAGRTLKSSGQTLPNLEFNGVGGEWTLQDDLSIPSITILNGKLIDNAKTVNVSGSILIASTQYEDRHYLESTGIWNMTASGDISNNGWYGQPINPIYDFRISENVVARRVNPFNVRSLTLGNGSSITQQANQIPYGYTLRISAPWKDNFISGSGSYSVVGARTQVFPDGVTRVQGAIGWDEDFVYGFSTNGGGTLRFGGDWVVSGALTVYGTDELSPDILDTNGYSLSAESLTGLYDYGRILLRSGNHHISGDIAFPQAESGIKGLIDFGTSNIYVAGNIDFGSTTVTPGTATIHMNATAAGRTLKSSGQTLPNLEFNGVGGEWTLQDHLNILSLTIVNGKLIDNAKDVNVGGGISISSNDNSLISTGAWTMTANGDISNGGYYSTYPPDLALSYNGIYNSIYDFRLADGVTARRTGHFNVRNIMFGNQSSITAFGESKALRIWHPWKDNFISNSGSYSISGNSVLGSGTAIYIAEDEERAQGAINWGENIIVGHTHAGLLKMSGDWTINGGLLVSGGYAAVDENTANVLDTNGSSLNVSGDLLVGFSNRSSGNRFHGKIKFSSGTHRIAGSLLTPEINTVGPQVGGYTHGYYDFGTSTIYIGGDLELNQYTSLHGANTATIILNGTQSQTINTTLPLHNLTVANSSAEGANFSSDLTLSGLFVNETPSSKMTFSASASYTFQNLILSGGAGNRIQLKSSAPGIAWKLNVLNADRSVRYADVADSDASGGFQIIANDGTSLDSGGNTHWLFGNYNTEVTRVSLSPSIININPGKTYQCIAKAYNILGQEIPATFDWSAKSAAGKISDKGLFTAGENSGLIERAVTVTSSGKSASVDANITPETSYVVPGWIFISPDSKVLKPKEEYQFSGKVYDTTGLLIGNAQPEWKLVDGGGEISPEGLFKAGDKDGVFVNSVVASYADVRSYATVVVRGDKPLTEKDETIISKIVGAGKAALDTAKIVAKNDPAKETALLVTAVATASAGASGLLGLLSAQMGIKDYLLFIINYFLSLRAARRKSKFGTVYDESTQRPLQRAMVRLFDFKTMRLVSTAITDKNGNYIFIVQPGEYVMSVIKPGYAFPSKMIRISQNLVDNYIGQTIVVNNDHPIINHRIPVDPSGNQQIKLGLIFRLLNSIYFRPIVLTIGSIMTVYSLLLLPKTLNFIIAGGFVLLWVAEAFIQNRNVKFSKVVDGATNKPISLALVRVLTSENKLVETFISDQYGRVLPKAGTLGDNLIVEKSGYNKIIQPASGQGLIEKKKFVLRRGDHE